LHRCSFGPKQNLLWSGWLASDRGPGPSIRGSKFTKLQLSPQLRGALEKRFGKKIETTVTVNPDLIGGARVTVGDAVLDGSVQAKLAAMRAQLRA
jgi:F-type H+-transporting ATPase subunit delta